MVAKATALRRENVPWHILFLSYRKLRFYTIKNAPRGSHFGGVELCRLRDPPQAENPAEQDSILFDKRRLTGEAWAEMRGNYGTEVGNLADPSWKNAGK